MPHDPHDTVLAIHNDRQQIPVFAGDFPVDQEILQLAASGRPQRPEPVARPAVSDPEEIGRAHV